MEASGLLVAAAAFSLGKGPVVPIEQKVVWTPHMVWLLWRTRKSLALPTIKPQFLGCLACFVVTIPVEIYLRHVVEKNFLLLVGTEYRNICMQNWY
jgi:hypothetical protein